MSIRTESVPCIFVVCVGTDVFWGCPAGLFLHLPLQACSSTYKASQCRPAPPPPQPPHACLFLHLPNLPIQACSFNSPTSHCRASPPPPQHPPAGLLLHLPLQACSPTYPCRPAPPPPPSGLLPDLPLQACSSPQGLPHYILATSSCSPLRAPRAGLTELANLSCVDQAVQSTQATWPETHVHV